jgi:hypothetical protein
MPMPWQRCLGWMQNKGLRNSEPTLKPVTLSSSNKGNDVILRFKAL